MWDAHNWSTTGEERLKEIAYGEYYRKIKSEAWLTGASQMGTQGFFQFNSRKTEALVKLGTCDQ